ncbi:entericidin A/B family lipoprotein [Benzoatithermus flavus]|uniref:Entericidin A/B family lipoprotein n=1 Tax=Benzoatithermus flavus TaxID=3108223 RepID=A0ABU8XR98_9PROT
MPSFFSVKKRSSSLVWVLLAALLASSTLTACNTIRGAGEDVEQTGRAIRHSTY